MEARKDNSTTMPRDATMDDGGDRRASLAAAAADSELQPLLDACDSLIRRGLSYVPCGKSRISLVGPSEGRPTSGTEMPDPPLWKKRNASVLLLEEEEEEQEWLSEMTRMHQEYLLLKRIRSSVWQHERDDAASSHSTSVLRNYGREMRDQQAAEVLRNQQILQSYRSEIRAVQAHLRRVQQATLQRLENETPSAERTEPRRGPDREQRLLHGVLLDLLPYVLPIVQQEESDRALRLQQRYL